MPFTPDQQQQSQTSGGFVPDSPVEAPTKGGVFSRLADYSKRGLQTATDIFVSPVAREIQRPFVSMYAGITGDTKPVKTPFGEVKPYSEVSSGEAAMGAFETATTVLPVEKIIAPVAKALKPVTGPIKSALSKAASSDIAAEAATRLANVSKEKVNILKESPQLVRKAQGMLEAGEEAIPAFGEEVYKAAEGAYKKAQQAWGASEKKLFETFGDKLVSRAQDFSDRVVSSLASEGVKVTDAGVDLAGTAFNRNATAQRVLGDIVAIMREPAETMQQVINKRVAVTNILDEIPKEAGSVRRVAKNAVKAFDELADEVTEGGAAKLRQEYARVAEPAKKILGSMTDADGRFSMDKARLFINRAMSDVKFDESQVLTRLDKVAGSEFSQQVKALGAAKAIERLDPVTSGRVLDVLKSYTIAKLPLVSALVSPKAWGEVILRGAEKAKPVVQKAATAKDEFTKLLLQNVLLKLGTYGAKEE